ncbi:MAG: cyclopropane fatty acyl phospholipid synthase [Candidatus Sulfobium sp.]|jgi:cyclopropane-fatty-acyl-phospholipid synthase
MSAAKDIVQQILADADISINGSGPRDIVVHDERLYQRVLTDGSLGLGEAYMDGWWDCRCLDELFCRIMQTNAEEKTRNWKYALHVLKARVFNLSSKSRSFEVGEKHYDIGNELYRNMLDKRMVYSCAYWKDKGSLDEAQEAKLDLICRKLGLKAGDRILDIGCGWGSFAGYAAEKYGVKVVGISVSNEQVSLGKELCCGQSVDLRLQDYRDLNEKFDHIVSVGMFEHVGYKNYRTFMTTVNRCLKDDGLFLLHTIGNNISSVTTDPWIYKYIFPNSMIPSMAQISAAVEGLFVMEDWHNLGIYYDRTLTAWFRNFGENWNKIEALYDDRFFRMWKYYLLSSAGLFRARQLNVWQIVLSKKGVPGTYQPVR